ncbi:hypothetical protein Hanom_Chr00s170918g01828781 [Helianthus anomalus]
MGEIRPDVIVQDKEVNENDNVSIQGAEFIIGRNSEGNVNNRNVLVRKKYGRKNGVINRVGSSGSNERPKKRASEDNDPFGIDRLIGIVNSLPSQSTGEDKEASVSTGSVLLILINRGMLVGIWKGGTLVRRWFLMRFLMKCMRL